MKKRKAYTYSFRLRPGRDDNIIALLDSAPELERSVLIRQALRAFIGQTQIIQPQIIQQPKFVIQQNRKEDTYKHNEFKPPQTEVNNQEIDLDSKLDGLVKNLF